MKIAILHFLVFIFGLLFAPIIHANTLAPAETQLKQYIADKKEEQLALLEKLVNINSGTANIAGVLAVGELLKPQFTELGFDTQWIEEPKEMKRAGTLIATHKGKSGKRILLIGHLDTVFPKDSAFQQFSRQGNIAIGPGVIDDKGGDVVILYALKALHSVHALDDATITVVLTGDEEDSGKPTTISRKPLIDVAHSSDIALEFEWAINPVTATIGRRGITNWMLETQGNEAHSSEIFKESAGFGAIFEMTRIINTMLNELGHEKNLTFSPGLILGGTTVDFDKNTSQGTAFGKGNVIAKTAMAKGDLRYLTVEQKLSAEKRIQSIVNHSLSGTHSAITFIDGIPPMQPNHNNEKLLQEYSKASEDLGLGSIKALDPGSRGASDISHVASIVPANLAGLGALGTGAHSTKETLQIDSLPIQTQRVAILLYRLINSN